MTLKRQLFIASLLMLLIPWAGLQFVLELDQALRDQAAQQLRHQATRLAGEINPLLSGRSPVPEGRPVIYADRASHRINLDGYGDDWPHYDRDDAERFWQSLPAARDGTRLSWMAATEGGQLYLLLHTNRSRPVWFSPEQPSRLHDQVTISWQENGRTLSRLIRSPTTGHVTGRVPGRVPGGGTATDFRVSGAWQTVQNGYQLELELPGVALDGRVGIELTWPTEDGKQVRWLATGSPEDTLIPVLSPLPALEHWLASNLSPGQGALVTEAGGWLRGQAYLPPPGERLDFEDLNTLQILEQISLNGLRALVRLYQPRPTELNTDSTRLNLRALPEQGLVRQPDGKSLLMVRQPLNNGRELVMTESMEQLLTLSGSTLGSVIARSSLLIIGLMLTLLGYASWLSWRITRLQRAVSASVDEDGRIRQQLPPARAGDELGALQRQFSVLVERLQGYTGYLESFSRRLSHELKTPVAVVHSSLDNLRHAGSEQEREQYIQRATRATERLSQILQGMSEAARLEQSFDHAEKETFDLADVLQQTVAAYQSLDPDHVIRYQGPDSHCPCHGSPELLVQLLDKLVDNARDFTPEGGTIEVALRTRGPLLELSVFNAGSQLPGHSATDIFSPFVSLRERGESAEGHLGQGLLIVRLIAEHHGGSVHAGNEADGVRFVVTLPRP